MNPCIQAVLCFVIVSVLGLIAFKIAERSVRFQCPICQKRIPGSRFVCHIEEEYKIPQYKIVEIGEEIPIDAEYYSTYYNQWMLFWDQDLTFYREINTIYDNNNLRRPVRKGEI